MSESLLSSPTWAVREYENLKLNATKSILPECLAVKPEKFDKMICAKISAWEKFGGYISSKDELNKIRRRGRTNMPR